jgi:2'-phosphotransferase
LTSFDHITALTGMRHTAEILIFINLEKALEAGIKFFLSANGVVLMKGDDTGFLLPECFLRVENAKTRVPLVGWDGPDTA